MDHYMGIDIGTSGCKAVVFDQDGRQISLAYREYGLLCPQLGWVELASEQVIDKCFQVIGEAAAEYLSHRSVDWVFPARVKPLRPSIRMARPWQMPWSPPIPEPWIM